MAIFWSLFLKDECIFVEYEPWPGKNYKGEIKAIFSLKEIVGYEKKECREKVAKLVSIYLELLYRKSHQKVVKYKRKLT